MQTDSWYLISKIYPFSSTDNNDRKLQDEFEVTLDWSRSLTDLLFAAEDLRAYTVGQGIETRIDILHYKIRLHFILVYIQLLRKQITHDDQKHFDNWISELIEWCKKGNEKRLSLSTSPTTWDFISSYDLISSSIWIDISNTLILLNDDRCIDNQYRQ